MLNIKVISVVGLLFLNQICIGQETFELNYNSSNNEFLHYTFQNSVGNYISLGGKQLEFGPEPVSPVIINIDLTGEIIDESVIVKEDSSYSFRYGLEKANGNYLIIGTLSDSVSPYDFNVTYICEMTPQLDIVWEKMHEIPEPYNNHLLINFLIDPDSNIIIQCRADSSQYGYNDLLMTMVLGMDGDQLDLNFYTGWKDYGSYSDIIFNYDSTAIYLIGDYVRPQSSLNEWIEMDMNLNIVNYTSVIDDEHYISTPLSAKMNPYGNIVMANRADMEPGANQDLYVKVMDTLFNTIHDTLLFYPENTYLAVNKGLGFTDPDNIWVTTFEGIPPGITGTEVFRFHIFDSELNLKGMKEYGGDTRYWFFDMIVTSDGGCLLTGAVSDNDGSYNANGYIIKVMPDDIITHAEETPFAFDKDVFVFPNPFSTEINIQTVRKGLSFNLYNVSGHCILSSEIIYNNNNTLSTGNLKPGSYFYNIQYENHIIQSGKIIKE
ncbi:MAG: T9SS type A sorting domain-containing protein [Bacteroidales bacterium]|nr:T9SS type A sorting domain-containing protein [Bacteroidales bacterium]